MKTTMALLAVAVFVILAGCKNQATVETPDKALTVQAPGDVTIARGETAQITIKLTRKNFSDPVKVKFENFPKGVDVVEAGGVDVKAGPVHVEVGHEPPAITGDSATFTLKAADDAAIVSGNQVTLTADGPDHKSVTTTFKVTVKEKS